MQNGNCLDILKKSIDLINCVKSTKHLKGNESMIRSSIKKLTSVIAVSGLVCSTAIAQDLGTLVPGPKPEKAPPPSCEPITKDPTEWDLSAYFGYNMTRGNADTKLLNLGFDAGREKDSNIYTINIAGADGSQDGEKTQRFIRGKLAYDRLLTEKFYLSTSGSFIADDIADLDYRTLISPAAGYFFIKNEKTKLAAETGPAYVFQKQGGDDENYLAWRVSNNFSWKFSNTAKIFQYADYLLNTDDTDQSIIVAKAGIEASLTSALALVLSVEDRYNSLPAEGRQKNDVLVSSALKVSF